jgi:hypothetical protein
MHKGESNTGGLRKDNASMTGASKANPNSSRKTNYLKLLFFALVFSTAAVVLLFFSFQELLVLLYIKLPIKEMLVMGK